MGLKIKKGDIVMVISGNDRPRQGKVVRGRVLAVNPRKGNALVEGVNVATKHMKAKSQDKPGGIVHQEAPIPLSKLMLVDPKAPDVASRFGTVTDDQGNKTRRLKKGGGEV
jgi:large subunit ribosomal protein L24